MGVSAHADYFAKVSTVEELMQAADFAEENSLPWLVLGGGSNVLFTKDVKGLVILNRISGKEIISEDDQYVYLKAGAGENWHELVMYCVEKGYAGIENLSLIPGTVGAAPIQNIGAYGVELIDVFESLEALELESASVKTFDKEECQFGYRDSVFKKNLKGKVIITSVTLKLRKHPELKYSYASLSDKLKEKGISEPTIKDISNAVIEVRQSKLPDPDEIGNTGSFFKNPVISVYQFDELKTQFPELKGYPVSERQVKVPAGWLIEKAGWKGAREGDPGVHDKQALVLVNYGNATGSEIMQLAHKIQRSVQEKFDISITPEVNLIG